MGNCLSSDRKELATCKELLNKLYPEHIKRYLLTHSMIDYKETLDMHTNVIVLFSDICGFTQISRSSNVEEVARFLHSIYMRTDEILDKYPLLQKIETIGDCIMIVSGLYTDELTDEHYNSMYSFAVEITKMMSTLKYKDTSLKLRTGINVGPVASGIVGNKVPRYCLFGHTVNLASRLQTTSMINQIHVSEAYKNGLALPSVVFYEENTNLKGLDVVKTFFALTTLSDHDSDKTSCTKMLRNQDFEL